MSLLFLISNIAVPLLILSYTSLVKVQQTKQFYGVKWLCLICYTFGSNMLHFLFLSESKLFIFLDLLVKLAIVFVPDQLNQKLEQLVRATHLERLVHFGRTFLLQQVFALHGVVTGLLLRGLSLEEENQLKSTVLRCFESHQTQLSEPLNNKIKVYQNNGANCDILTPQMLNEERRQRQILRIQLNQANQASQKRIQPPTDMVKNSTVKQTVTDLQVRTHEKFYEPPSEQNQYSMRKKNSYIIQRSNTDLGIAEDEDDRPIATSDHAKNGGQMVRNSEKRRQEPPMRRHKSPEQRVKREEDEPSMILNKLDVSEYSDLFEDDEEDTGRKQMAKVQAIVEIGGIQSSRLEIYNIELYSNSEIRIVSLYGREFERHKLISMRPLKHDYFQLRLQGGKVESRKVKFRGPFAPFNSYLEPKI